MDLGQYHTKTGQHIDEDGDLSKKYKKTMAWGLNRPSRFYVSPMTFVLEQEYQSNKLFSGAKQSKGISSKTKSKAYYWIMI